MESGWVNEYVHGWMVGEGASRELLVAARVPENNLSEWRLCQVPDKWVVPMSRFVAPCIKVTPVPGESYGGQAPGPEAKQWLLFLSDADQGSFCLCVIWGSTFVIKDRRGPRETLLILLSDSQSIYIALQKKS